MQIYSFFRQIENYKCLYLDFYPHTLIGAFGIQFIYRYKKNNLSMEDINIKFKMDYSGN